MYVLERLGWGLGNLRNGVDRAGRERVLSKLSGGLGLAEGRGGGRGTCGRRGGGRWGGSGSRASVG